MEAVEDPSQEQIEAGCHEIQAGWTPAERQRRAVGSVWGWLPSLWADCPDQGELVPW